MLGKTWASAKAQLRCARAKEPQGSGTAHPALCSHAHSPASACTSPSSPNLLLASPPACAEAQAPWQPPQPVNRVTFSVAHGGRWQRDPPKAEHADGQAVPSRDTCFSKGRAARSYALPWLSLAQQHSGPVRRELNRGMEGALAPH